MKKYILSLFFLISCVLNTYAHTEKQQQEKIEISGIVLDQNKEPLVGVNVSVKDIPGLGAITDINGKFKIKVEPYQWLVFTFIGFDKQEILVKEQKSINVIMQEAKATAIDEVVITGTGAQKKITMTGAATTVDVNTLRTSTSSITNALAGNVAGIMARQTSGQPGNNISEFWIRGISTFGAGSGALVLIDGFERDMNEINIEDIESFTVLKDASATAIYGSRGANGVVLITTKRGKSGKVQIDAKVETTYNTRTYTPELVDGYTYANLMNEARTTRNKEAFFSDEKLYILRNGLDKDLYPNVDWMDVLLKKGAPTYRATLNLNGGGSLARYYVSVSYVDEGGMYKVDEGLKDYNTNANYRRWNYRLNVDMDITKSTLLKVGVAGSLDKKNEPGMAGNIWASAMRNNPISVPVMYSNGYVPAYGSENDQLNPWVAATQTGYQETWNNKLQANATLEQSLNFITKGLKFIGRYGFDTNNYQWINRKKFPEMWRAEQNRASDGSLVMKKIKDEQLMTQESSSNGNRKEYLEAELHYDRTFGDHIVGAVFKYSQDKTIDTSQNGNDIMQGIDKRHQGLAGRFTYGWKYRYFFDFNFGYNGSENFAPGHQYGFFPAYSAAWNIAEEPIIKKHLKWMNMFKVRFSYGKVGNDNVGTRFPYLYTIADRYKNGDNEIIYGGYDWAQYPSSYSFGGLGFADVASNGITWEVAEKNDLGIDLALFNDKFTATIDYFDEKRTGIYMVRNYLPRIVGLNGHNPAANVGAVSSKGFDGHFSYKQRINDVNLTVRGNITYSKNEVLERDEENNVYAYQMQRGYRVDQCKGLIAEGLFKDYDDIRNSPTQSWGKVQPGDIKYRDVNGDGVINDGDQVAIGATSRPNLIYGLGASASWKGLDVNVHFQGAGKSTFFTYGKCVWAFTEGEWGNIFKGMLDNRWVDADTAETLGIPANENPNASYPRLSYQGDNASNNNYRNSTFWLKNGRYLRLKTIDVGYTLPKSIVNKMHFNNIRIFLVGTNLLTWSSFKTWDPEMGDPRGESYPLTKSITMGISVNL